MLKHRRKTVAPTSVSRCVANELAQLPFAHLLAHRGRPAQSGRRLLHEEKINEQSISLSSPARRRYQRMNPINSDTSSQTTFNGIAKPNRAHGRAEAMRQVFFLAHCGRPAQSGRCLLEDEATNEQSIPLTCLTSSLFRLADT